MSIGGGVVQGEGVKVGSARSTLKELSRGGMVRRGAQSAVVQLHVALLSVVLNESGLR